MFFSLLIFFLPARMQECKFLTSFKVADCIFIKNEQKCDFFFLSISVKGTMPITFDSSITSDEKVKIKAQMDRFNAEMAGCLQFV